jgi:hypothetical protein
MQVRTERVAHKSTLGQGVMQHEQKSLEVSTFSLSLHLGSRYVPICSSTTGS